MNTKELQSFLDEKAALYEHPRFIKTDPIQIPHQFDQKQDIEIAGFLTATIAWGNRTAILKSAHKMMAILQEQPHAFIQAYDDTPMPPFVHRTFNSQDFTFLCKGLHRLYQEYTDMDAFFGAAPGNTVAEKIHSFRAYMLQSPHEKRSEKHLSDPLKGSAAKRLNMFLRWMVRSHHKGVDFGLWSSLHPGNFPFLWMFTPEPSPENWAYSNANKTTVRRLMNSINNCVACTPKTLSDTTLHCLGWELLKNSKSQTFPTKNLFYFCHTPEGNCYADTCQKCYTDRPQK